MLAKRMYEVKMREKTREADDASSRRRARRFTERREGKVENDISLSIATRIRAT